MLRRREMATARPAGTIGMAGSLRRIGTTTQAVQLVMFLKIMGMKAAYIEMNSYGFVHQIQELYDGVKQNKKTAALEYKGVSFYTKDQLGTAMGQDFDYLVKDYGNCQDKDFQQVSFMEQDRSVIVAGIKPNEIFDFQILLEEGSFPKARYIFSFVPREDRDVVRELMEDKAQLTWFADYTPEMFRYDNGSGRMYKAILQRWQYG